MALYKTQLLNTPATHSFSVVRAVDGLFTQLTGLMTSVIRSPFSHLAQKGIIGTLQNIVHGQLTIVTEGKTYTFGDFSEPLQCSPKQAMLIVKNDIFWTRLALFGDLGFAESFMDGDVECSDISSLLQIVIINRPYLSGIDHMASSVLSLGRRLTAHKFLGDLATSRANISAHYDLGNVMFSSFLSKDMNYSSAIFKDFNEDLAKDVELRESHEEAQICKMQNLLNRLRIEPGDRVLEIGTGWGSLAIMAAESVDCTIDTVTLSSEQRDLAEQRIKDAGLSDRITVHLVDFRQIKLNPDWAGAFDRFVSVEMIENVGREFIEEFWSVVDWAMKKGRATGVVQVITMPEARIPAYDRAGVDFIQKWVIFPGCYIPSFTFLIETMHRGSSGRFIIDSVSNIGPHYARTLREWKARFLSNWETVIAATLRKQYHLDEEGLTIFKRKWIYYFDYCEAGFVTRTLGDHIITFTREGNADFGCDLGPSSNSIVL